MNPMHQLTRRPAADWNVRVTYECTGKQWICFSYLYMQDGTASSMDITESDTVKDVTVSGMSGKLILPQSSESANVIIWFDTAQNLMFSIHANVDESVIITIAESVSLCSSTNWKIVKFCCKILGVCFVIIAETRKLSKLCRGYQDEKEISAFYVSNLTT